MNRRAMLTPIRFSLPLVALICAACSQAPAQPPLEEAPLYGATIGGDFTLDGEDGKPVSWSDFDGQWRIIYFGWAYCPDICPTDMQRAMAGLRKFEKASPDLGTQIQPIFVSVDPERDTPEVLAEFTSAFHPRLIGVTGDIETLRETALAFGTTFSKSETNDEGGYRIDHFGYTYLFGPEGQPVAMLPTDQGADAVADELAKWVR